MIRDAQGVVHKEPDREVQRRIEFIFETFFREKSAYKVLRTLSEYGLRIPRRTDWGDTVWRSPTLHAIVAVLRNPAYAGAFVYGRTQTQRTGPGDRGRRKKLPLAQWRICLPDQYPSYISWRRFQQIDAMLRDNYAHYDTRRGIPRSGAALLQGLVYCGECGHKLQLQYTDGPHYLCQPFCRDGIKKRCQNIPAEPLDQQVVAQFFRALSVVELGAYERAVEHYQRGVEQRRQTQRDQLERLRYQAALCERQFQRVDPDNRLVAGELEKRWETTLRELHQKWP